MKKFTKSYLNYPFQEAYYAINYECKWFLKL